MCDDEDRRCDDARLLLLFVCRWDGGGVLFGGCQGRTTQKATMRKRKKKEETGAKEKEEETAVRGAQTTREGRRRARSGTGEGRIATETTVGVYVTYRRGRSGVVVVVGTMVIRGGLLCVCHRRLRARRGRRGGLKKSDETTSVFLPPNAGPRVYIFLSCWTTLVRRCCIWLQSCQLAWPTVAAGMERTYLTSWSADL